jgi:hypothetical protein
MAVEEATPHTRRALLGAALGGAAALVAQYLGRPLVRAAGDDGTPVAVGGEYYDARSKIYINNGTNSEYVFAAQSTAGGIAISGVSNSNAGVYGYSESDYGVHGESAADIGVYGETESGTGVVGTSRGASVGVFGSALGGPTAIGVRALSNDGTALKVDGKATFSRSGIATVAVGAKTTTVTPGFDVTSDSQVLCTLDTNQSGLYLKNVLKSANANNFKINLSALVGSGKYAKVAWLILN